MSRRSKRARERAQHSGRRPGAGGQPGPAAAGAGTGAAGSAGQSTGAQTPRTSVEQRSSGPTGSRRAGRRARSVRRYDDRGFFDRYRGLLLTLFALAGIGLIGVFFVTSATARSYQCDSLLTPPPGAAPPESGSPVAGGSPTAAPAPTQAPSPAATASPGASPSPTPTPAPDERLGFVTNDLGRQHLATATNNKRYAYCPPASGEHYNAQGLGPVRRNFYGPEGERDPGGWIHNLEHGYVVLLYSCGENGNNCPSSAEMDEMRQWFDRATNRGGDVCRIPNKTLVARFDQMSTRFALLAWDRVLLMNNFNLNQALTFADQWINGPSAPEPGAC